VKGTCLDGENTNSTSSSSLKKQQSNKSIQVKSVTNKPNQRKMSSTSPTKDSRTITSDYLTSESEKYQERVIINGMVTTQPDDINNIDRETFSSLQRQEPKSKDTLTQKEYENFKIGKERNMMSNELKNAKTIYSNKPTKQTTPDKLGNFSKQTNSSNNKHNKSLPKHICDKELIENMKGKERQNMKNENKKANEKYLIRELKKNDIIILIIKLI